MMVQKTMCLNVLLVMVTLSSLVDSARGAQRSRRRRQTATCRTEAGQSGTCTIIQRCPYLSQLLQLVKRGRSPPNSLSRLRRETEKCPFIGTRPQICCGDANGGGFNIFRQNPTRRPAITRRPTRQPRPTRRSTRRPLPPPTTTRRPSFFTNPTSQQSAPVLPPFPTSRPGGGSLQMTLPSEDECGKRTFNQRVIGGQGATIGSWPWAASVGYRVRGRSGIQWNCAASLISSRHALTAAHCIHGIPSHVSPEMVRLGELDFNREPDCLRFDPSVCADIHRDVSIIGLVTHPGFQGASNNAFEHDIGLITLGESVASTDFIRPICLPLDLSRLRDGSDSVPGKRAFIAGWGRSRFSSTLTPLLQEAKISVQSPGVCERTYRRDITAGLGRRLCAGEGKGVDTCKGDSGGPLMMPSSSGSNWYITGITSFGAINCGSNAAVYTRVHGYLNWIQDNMKVEF